MTDDFNHEDMKFSSVLGDWFDWEIDDGEIALTRGGQVKLNGKALSAELVTLASKYSWAFKDAVRLWKRKAEDFSSESADHITEADALHELDQAKRIIDRHIASGFVVEFCHGNDDCFDYAYRPGLYAESVDNSDAAA